VENVYNILQQIYSGNDVPNSITIAREFYRRYYKNILASFFWALLEMVYGDISRLYALA